MCYSLEVKTEQVDEGAEVDQRDEATEPAKHEGDFLRCGPPPHVHSLLRKSNSLCFLAEGGGAEDVF